MLKSFGKIHNSLSVLFARRRSLSLSYFLEDPLDTAMEEPGDVMEGHFVVVANNGEETKRFVVELHYLSKPSFLGLLELAREEYGFEQEGALVIPCHPQEIEKILDETREEYARDGGCLEFNLQALVHRKLMYMYNVFFFS